MGKFKAGAVVKLNTGNGPLMSVQGPMSTSGVFLICKWFFENKVLHDNFHEDSLIEATPEASPTEQPSLQVSFVGKSPNGTKELGGPEDEPPAQH